MSVRAGRGGGGSGAAALSGDTGAGCASCPAGEISGTFAGTGVGTGVGTAVGTGVGAAVGAAVGAGGLFAARWVSSIGILEAGTTTSPQTEQVPGPVVPSLVSVGAT